MIGLSLVVLLIVLLIADRGGLDPAAVGRGAARRRSAGHPGRRADHPDAGHPVRLGRLVDRPAADRLGSGLDSLGSGLDFEP